MRLRWSLALLSLLIFIAAAALSLRHAQAATIPLHKVVRRAFVRQVSAEGTLEAVKSVPVSLPADLQQVMKVAWISENMVPVRRGDTLFRFDATDFRQTLERGQNERTTIGNRVIKLEAETDADRRNLLRDSAQAGAEFEVARKFQRSDDEIFSRYEAVESGLDAYLAEQKKEFADRMLQLRHRLAEADRDLLLLEQRKAGLSIERTESSMRSLEITSPADGIFILDRDWRGEIPRVGSSLWSGNTLAQIAQSGAMKAEAYILEADSGGISPGQSATVAILSQPGRDWKATVERIDKVAKTRYPGVPVQYFGVTFNLQKSDPAWMKPGSRIRATIETWREMNAVVIPREAIFVKSGKRIVYLSSPDGFQPREVRTGPISNGIIVVTKGLSGGETIALADPTISQTVRTAKARPEKTP